MEQGSGGAAGDDWHTVRESQLLHLHANVDAL